MSLNNSRGFPSILLVNFSILQTEGKTKLSKNEKKNMRFCVTVRPKMYYCTISTGMMVISCVYSLPTDILFSQFRKVQFSVSYFIYLIYNVCYF